MRAGIEFPARRNYWKIARGEISGDVEVEGEPLLCRFADERCRRGHAGYDGRRYEVDEHIAAVGDDLRRVAARQAEIAGDGESSSDGSAAEFVHWSGRSLCLRGKWEVEHPTGAELVLEHAEVGIPEGVLQRHRDLAAGRKRGEESLDLVAAFALNAHGEILAGDVGRTGHDIRSHEQF